MPSIKSFIEATNPIGIAESIDKYVTDGMVTLTHFSDTPDLTVIDPAKQFSGADRRNREVQNVTGKSLPRSYFGIGVGQPGGYDPKKDGPVKRLKYRYETEFPASEIYDFDRDHLDIRSRMHKYSDELRAAHPNNLTDQAELYRFMDEAIRAEGYKGVSLDYASYGQACYMWVPVKVKQVPLDGAESIQEAAGLSRVISHIQNRPFVLISAFRGDKSKIANIRSQKDMQRQILQLGYTFIKTAGGYVEDDHGEVLEQSVFVLGDDASDLKDLETEMRKLAVQYEQDSIALGDTNSVYLVNSASGERERIGSTKRINTSNIGQFFTQVGNQKFAFAE